MRILTLPAMELVITRIDDTLPLPEYGTPGACAFDVPARVTTIVPPRSTALVPTNLVVRVPEGHCLLLCSRSSTPVKKHLATPHGFGIIDQDFRGSKDEMRALVWNMTDEPVTIERGERIAQALLVPIVRPTLVERPFEETADRGGFGTTGQ